MDPTSFSKIYIESFAYCSAQSGADPSLVQHAARALEEIVGRSVHQDSPILLAPGFASHGLDHPFELARIANELADQKVISFEHLSPEERADCLLLSYCAFLLHDVGMLILPEDLNVELTTLNIADLWSSDIVRNGHDKRSLLFIEKFVEQSSQLSAWGSYWKQRFAGNGPTPAGSYELFALARVCQSHADPEACWLAPEGFETYVELSRRRTVNLRSSFGPIWDTLKRPVETAATLLSLCDLLDIREDRIQTPNNDRIRKLTLPKTPEARRERFFHWVGNKLASVRILDGSIRVAIRAHEDHPLAAELIRRRGPVGDLVRYGTHPRMKQAARDFLGATIAISIEHGAVDEVTWKEAEAFAQELACWDFSISNSKVSSSARPFDQRVLHPLWFPLAGSDISKDFPIILGPNVSTIIGMRRAGLLLEDAYNISGTCVDSTAYYPRIADHVEHYRSDSFVAALRIAREIATSPLMWTSGAHADVRIATKGSLLFSELSTQAYQGPPAIILVAVDQIEDAGDFGAMVARNQDQPVRIVFFGKSPQVIAAVGQVPRVQPQDLTVNVEALRGIADAVRDAIWNVDGKADWHPWPVGSPSPEHAPISVGDLAQGWILGHPDGIHGTLTALLHNPGSRSIAEGALVLLRMAETRRVGDRQAQGIEQVVAAYTSALNLQRHPSLSRQRVRLPEATTVMRASALRSVQPAFDPWCAPSLAEARKRTNAALAAELTVEAVAAVLVDALTLVAVGEALNPYAVDWDQIPRALAPAVRSSLRRRTGAPEWLRIATPLALSIVDVGINAPEDGKGDPILKRADRWQLALDLSDQEPSVASDRGMLGFQVIFRLLKSDWTCAVSGDAHDASAVFNLGRLEALCSVAGSSGLALSIEVTDFEVARQIDDVSKLFVSSVCALTDLELKHMNSLMAFDILFQYRARKGKVKYISELNPLWVAGCAARWDEAAKLVRDHPDAAAPLYSSLRSRFNAVLELTPKHIMRERPLGMDGEESQ